MATGYTKEEDKIIHKSLSRTQMFCTLDCIQSAEGEEPKEAPRRYHSTFLDKLQVFDSWVRTIFCCCQILLKEKTRENPIWLVQWQCLTSERTFLLITWCLKIFMSNISQISPSKGCLLELLFLDFLFTPLNNSSLFLKYSLFVYVYFCSKVFIHLWIPIYYYLL